MAKAYNHWSKNPDKRMKVISKIKNTKKEKPYIYTQEVKEEMSRLMKGKPSRWKGKHFSEESKKKLSISHMGLLLGEKNPNWSGDNVCYRHLHTWVERRLGKPMCCDFCGELGLHRYHWANKSGKYKRNITDWIRLCPKCHGAYDKTRRSK